MNIHSNAHMVIILSYSPPGGSCASHVANTLPALFSRFLCPWRPPESQQTSRGAA